MTPLSVLMCHAPIVVPAVGGARARACAPSTRAMAEAARRVMAAKPEGLVVLSPHTPRVEGAFSLVTGPRVRGDLGDFGAPEARCDLPHGKAMHRTLAAACAQHGVALEEIAPRRLDHGAMVPLSFLVDAGWRGDTLVLGLPAEPHAAQLKALGRALAAASAGKRWVLIASGDCSHRLLPGAPAGFDPRAQEFDAALLDRVQSGDNDALFRFDEALRERAAEDVLDTVQVAATCAGTAVGREVLSYEGPFGVGYLVAVLHHAEGARVGHDDETELGALVDVAEDALHTHLNGGRHKARADVESGRFTGVFVTWRKGGDLRGCIGRMTLEGDLMSAVRELAVSAAIHDPRFPPVTPEELPHLTGEVTLLHPTEPVADMRALDPRVWGVEVSAGWRRGVLLPGLEGVDTVEQQLAIVLRKAGIASHERFELRRFRAQKVLKAHAASPGAA
ncbi:MAG: AmmeMemoRadiSam system protein A [Deltaproteobacteria bacterium]|nr:AmmeMemoRadiSam system protein A [Deltaproteobacteria bacterium]